MNNDLFDDTQALLGGRIGESGATRRTALKAALGVGYAAAAMPIMAQTAIKTPATGLVSGEVTIDVNGFKMPAYRSAPAGKTGLPVVFVISEIFGVHEYIADVTRRLAQAGYMAIAPELFVRQGDPSGYGEIAKLQAEIISKVPDAQVMADLDACVAWAAANGGNTDKLAITGFCWGG
ncbi:MAG: dienelactone hydrolase family protein, partial [Hydrogenophaga sp.]|nr:dienelactone hydrolase family protein [Hydrogenophaga sp.]